MSYVYSSRTLNETKIIFFIAPTISRQLVDKKTSIYSRCLDPTGAFELCGGIGRVIATLPSYRCDSCQ